MAADQGYKLAALQALATGGSTAKKALDDQRKALEASRTGAVKDAMLGAAKIGADTGGVNAALEGIIANPALAARAKQMSTLGNAAWWTGANIAKPTSALFDAQAAAAKQASRGGGGRGGGGGGGYGGGGGGGGSGGEFPNAYWVDWWEHGGPLGSPFHTFGSQSKNQGRFNTFVSEVAPLRGAARDLARGYGAPKPYRIGAFNKLPTLKQAVESGAARVRNGQMSRKQYLDGIRYLTQNVIKPNPRRAKSAVKRATKLSKSKRGRR